MLTEETLASGMRVWTARPDTTEQRPAVLLLHERYGPVQHSFNMIERLANDGYVACVPDTFHRHEGDRGPIERAEGRVDPTDADALEDLDETLAYLRTLSYVDGGKIGIAGFCASGRTPLVFAAARDAATAIAIFHGGIYPRDYVPEYPGQETVANLIPRVQCPILGAFGELDRLVPLENVARFRRELDGLGKNYQIRVYGDTPHGWLNTTMPDGYRKEAAEDGWRTLVTFFADAFDGKWSTGEPIRRFEADPSIAYDFS